MTTTKHIPKLRFPEFKYAGDWEEKKLGAVADYENGRAQENDITEIGQYVVVNSKFISTEGKTKKFSNSANCIAQINDILMVLSDLPNGKALAKCYLVESENLYAVNQRIARLTPQNVDNKILFYVLNRNNYFLSLDDGVNQTNLRRDVVLNCPIILPNDFKEQNKIADCISTLDDLIGAENEKLEALKEHKKGLMQVLFPAAGEKVPKLRFPEFHDAGDWEEKTLGEVAEITTGASNREDSNLSGQYSFFDRSQDIRLSNRYLFDAEAIIVPGEGQEFSPKYFIGKFDLHQRTYAIMNFQDCSGKFLFFFIGFNSQHLIKYAVGSTVKSLRLPMFIRMPIALPSLVEQTKIANCLSSLDEQIATQSKKTETLKEHKKGLMQGLFPSIN